jgi:hypothetical protein
MALLRVINFGGLMPSADQRALPPNAATVATNLHPNSNEFRPTLAAVVRSAVFDLANPRTIYRMGRTAAGALNTDPATGWKSYLIETAHAKWANAADLTERTTVSPLNGSYPPRVIDATGTDRLLGVPAPAKPTVTINLGTYYTEKERESDLKTLRALILKAINAYLYRAKVGATYTADAIQGYLENGAEMSSQPSPQRARVYRYDAEEGTLTDAYTAAAEADVKWVQATRKGVWIVADGTPAWMGSAGQSHYAINYHAYGIGYKLNTEAALVTALDLIQYIDADQAADIAEVVADLFDPAAKPAQAVIVPLKEAVEKLEDTLNKRPPGARTDTEITAERVALLEATAKQIWNAIRANARVDLVGAGA